MNRPRVIGCHCCVSSEDWEDRVEWPISLEMGNIVRRDESFAPRLKTWATHPPLLRGTAHRAVAHIAAHVVVAHIVAHVQSPAEPADQGEKRWSD